MKKYIALLLTLFLNFFIYAQEEDYLFLEGELSLSNAGPASFAHIYIKNKNMGGITDLKGGFSFNMPAKFAHDTLVATFVGYETLEIPIQDMLGSRRQTYVMDVKAIELDEVIVYAANQVLKNAIRNFQSPSGDDYYLRKGVISMIRQENEEYTLLEQITFNLYYRRDVENPYGYEPVEHRRTIDHSRFPYIDEKFANKSFGIEGFFGMNIEEYIRQLWVGADTLKFDLSDVVSLDGENHLVISHRAEDGIEVLFYIRENDSHLTKIERTVHRAQFGMFIGGGAFNNNIYNEFSYRIKSIYHFSDSSENQLVTSVESEEYSQVVEKLTGKILYNYKNIRKVNFTDFVSLSEQSKKHDDKVRLPIKGLKYNPDFWTSIDQPIPAYIVESLSKWGSLESQFEATDGDIEVDGKMGKYTFTKKDQRKQSKIEDVSVFIEDLINDRYEADYPPKLDWSHIPDLLEIANNSKVIDRFPRNILSRVYLDKCQAGIVAMWLIDSIRKNEGRKPRKAWYISPMPLLEDGEDRAISALRNSQFIPHNSHEKLTEAYEAFTAWWETAQDLGAGKAKRINPLEDSDLNWVFRD